jgi:hypothetical protein
LLLRLPSIDLDKICPSARRRRALVTSLWPGDECGLVAVAYGMGREKTMAAMA